MKKYSAIRPNKSTFLFRTLSILLFTLWLGPLPGAWADKQEIDEINLAIKNKKARWVAGETEISKLPKELRKLYAGTLKPGRGEKAVQEAPPLVLGPDPLGVPVSLDWRNVNSFLFVTPVRNQGNCGSCWAFATTAALESRLLIDQQTPGAELNLAEQVLVSCAGAGSCSGGYISTASDYIRNFGLPLETCLTYGASNITCANACAAYQNATYQISGWHYIATTAPTVDGLKNALYTYGPLVTTMDVYSDFFSYRTGIYSLASGTYQGGHAVLLVGYDDTGQYFIVKNSWGTGWGEAGYFKIAYSELKSLAEFGYWTIAYEGKQPEPPAPTCTYTISPTSKSFKNTAGTGSITVTAPSGCGWTGTELLEWVNITSGTSGTGSGTISYQVSGNTGSLSRIGTIKVEGQTFTIKQSGARTPRTR